MTSVLLNLDLANNTISPCFFFISLIIDLYFSVPVVIAQIFNPITELVIPTGIPAKEAKAQIEIHPVIAEAKNQYNLELYKLFCAFYSSIHFALFLRVNYFLVYIFQSKFLTHIFKVIIYFQLNQESLLSQLILIL